MVCVFHQSFPFLMLDLCKDQTLFCVLQDGSALLSFVWMRTAGFCLNEKTLCACKGIFPFHGAWHSLTDTWDKLIEEKSWGASELLGSPGSFYDWEHLQKLLYSTETGKADQRKCSTVLLSEPAPKHFTRHQELCIPDEILAISWSQFISTPNHLKLRSMLSRCSLQGE